MRRPIRVILADDHSIVRMGLRALLESDRDITVVGEAEDGEEAVRLVKAHKPDTVIMDLMMSGKDGIAATAEIHAAVPEAKILLLTTFGTSDGISKALEAGAAGALLKSTANDQLLKSVHAVTEGRRIISEDVRQLLADDPPARELSPRQMEILTSVIRGLTNRDIASQLGISPDVVKEHLNAIFDKIGAANRTEAVAIALRKHLLKI